MKKLLLVTLLFTLLGCRNYDKEYFNGEIKIDNTKIDTSFIKRAKLVDISVQSDYISPQMLIYDSLMINYLFSDNNFFFNIVNLKNGELLGQFCHKGNGDNELLYCMALNGCYRDGDEVKALVADTHKSLLYEWNISKSLATKTTVFDTIVEYKMADSLAPYDYIHKLTNSKMLGYLGSSAADFSRTKADLPAIEIRDIYTGEVSKTINVFKDTFEDEKTTYEMIETYPEFIPSFYYFYSNTAVKPDGRYAVQAMKYIAQINIIDLETGVVKGIRLEDSPSFSVFGNKNIKRQYFSGNVVATNDFIYAEYSGTKGGRGAVPSKYIYKFDWNGKLVDVYDLGIEGFRVLYNQATNELYALNSADLKLYLVKID